MPYGETAMSMVLSTQHMTVLTKDTLPQLMIMYLADTIMMRIVIFEK
jgi:hypothetical protein